MEPSWLLREAMAPPRLLREAFAEPPTLRQIMTSPPDIIFVVTRPYDGAISINRLRVTCRNIISYSNSKRKMNSNYLLLVKMCRSLSLSYLGFRGKDRSDRVSSLLAVFAREAFDNTTRTY